MTTPADPFAVIRTRQYVVLLAFAAVLGVVVSTGAYWFLKLVADIQGWVYIDLPKGLGFHGTPSWWALLPLAVAGVVVGLTIRYLPGRGGHSPADGFKASGVAPGVPPQTADAIVQENATARIDGLRASLSVLAVIALIAVPFSRRIPAHQPSAQPASETAT